ncbi:efflux RND transporter periplasmic adaptor subunit [Microvirga massiliensis]|uniref:efflux RND transporter periplasmic adaptor subunit n=1 Tax=Microvirga massiliensis TaxID=1033741 RepID=UPI00062B89A4|nr:efflux RND transporter periplasmic adaptor subunit [Microvirga massiliensis]
MKSAFSALAIILFALTACQEAPATPARAARPVLVTEVRFAPETPTRSFVATVRARIETDLGFRVAGKVAERLVDVGDRIRAGTPLARLDESDLRLQREQADAELRAASAALTQARAELQRIRTLRQDGWSTASLLEKQTAAEEEARGRMARAEKALSLADNALSYAVLNSDSNGVVTAVHVEPGQVLASGQPAFRIAHDEKEAVVALPEAQVAVLSQGDATLSLWSNAGRVYRTTLRELSPAADPVTRTYLARFSIPDAGPEVQLGMTATLTIESPRSSNVARLPLSSLYDAGNGPSLWTVDLDGRLALRPVTVRSYEADAVLVTAGVRDGDQVVAMGVQKLDPGQRVRVVNSLTF